MIEFFDILNTIKNKHIHMKGSITPGTGYYEKSDLDDLFFELKNINDELIDIKKLEMNKKTFTTDFEIDVNVTDKVYRELMKDYEDLIDYYHPDAIHIGNHSSLFDEGVMDSILNRFRQAPSLFNGGIASGIWPDFDTEEWVERIRVQ